jgi:hypothetical protein
MTVCPNCVRLDQTIAQFRLKCEELEIDKMFLADKLEFTADQLRLMSESRLVHEQSIINRVQSFLSRPSKDELAADDDSEASVISLVRWDETQCQLREKLEELIVLKSELYDLKKAMLKSFL